MVASSNNWGALFVTCDIRRLSRLRFDDAAAALAIEEGKEVRAMDDAAAAGKPAVYIETTVISYLTSRPSRDVLVLAHQEMTREWWTAALPRFECFVSPAVVEEISRGDSAEAQRRLDAIQDFAELAWEPDIQGLSNEFARALQLPVKARADADHLAYAS